MAAQDLNVLKSYLADYVTRITKRSKNGMYVCPLCGSGTGIHRTGAFSITKDGQRWKCFGCDRGGDIFDLCAEYEHVSPSDATKRIISMYGSAATQTDSPRRSTAAAEVKNDAQDSAAAQPRSYADEIARYADALPGSAGQAY